MLKNLIFYLFYYIIKLTKQILTQGKFMQSTNLFIPSKIKIGFQKRHDTFTGKLAYIIYYDEKGKLRKEDSWKSWCDPKIESIELENTPRNGYIFNKGVQRYGHWGSGRSVIRVYDPRDFEFEVTVDNLIGLLMHSDVSKRDIVEDCVFAWAGKELILLPANSEEYKASVEYTKKQSEKISTKELVKGYSYNQKKSEDSLIYVGHFEWFDWGYTKDYSKNYHRSLGKKHVFYNSKNNSFSIPGVATLSSVNSSEVVSDYAEIVDKFFATMHSQPIAKVTITPQNTPKNYMHLYREVGSNTFQSAYFYGYNRHNNSSPFNNVDNHVSTIKFSISNRECEKKNVGEGRSYYNYQIGPIGQEMTAKAVEMGFNVNNMSTDDVFTVFSVLGFGNISYVMENNQVHTEVN